MKYLKKLFLSLIEVIIVIVCEYTVLFLAMLILGIHNGIIYGSILMGILELVYVSYIFKKDKIKITMGNYLPYLVLGLSVSVVYNMIIFKMGIHFDIIDVPLILNLIGSGFIGPILEETIFTHNLLCRLEKFNSKKMTILLTCLVFALCHNNVPSMIFAFIIGLINTNLYMKKRNLLIPIFVHMGANIISTFLFDFNLYILILGIVLLGISSLIIKRMN